MTSKSQIIVKDSAHEIWFYRHSDGYPVGNLPQIFKFMKWLDDNKLRKSALQSSGWLVILGSLEYELKVEPTKSIDGWKVGAYEPSPSFIFGDTEWLYTIDVEENTLTIRDMHTGVAKSFTFEELKKHEGHWNEIEDMFKE